MNTMTKEIKAVLESSKGLCRCKNLIDLERIEMYPREDSEGHYLDILYQCCNCRRDVSVEERGIFNIPQGIEIVHRELNK